MENCYNLDNWKTLENFSKFSFLNSMSVRRMVVGRLYNFKYRQFIYFLLLFMTIHFTLFIFINILYIKLI